MLNQMAVICDDLTGAMEAGLQLHTKGFDVYVTIDEQCIAQIAGNGSVLVIDTESRNVSEQAAVSSLQAALTRMDQASCRLIYKKVDSTLRGNLGKELETVIRHGSYDMAVFAAALPFNGRTTRHGHHYLNGSTLVESDLAKDPFSPICDAYIPNVIKQQTAFGTNVVLLEEIRKGKDFLANRLKELQLTGCLIAVVDAETDDDLEIIAAVLAESSLNILPCGSAGLFSKLNLPPLASQQPREKCKENSASAKPVVVISGSPAQKTKEQIQVAATHGYPVVRIEMNGINDELFLPCAIREMSNKVIGYLREGQSVIIDCAGKGKSEIAAQYNGHSEALLAASRQVREILTGVFENIARETEIAGVMIIGGDTANAVCKKMKVQAIKIIDEVEPFIPVGIMLQDGQQNLTVVSKAGGFGSPDIIIKAIRYLRGERES